MSAFPKKRSRSPKVYPEPSQLKMLGYEMPKGALLSWKWAEKRLKQSHNYWIATVRPNGRPHVMVVWGLWFHGVLYFSTGRLSRKAQNLTRNPHCVICSEMADQAVIMEGVARKVPRARLLQKIRGLYERKYKWDMFSLDNVVYAVYPSVAFELKEKKSFDSHTRWKFPAQ